MNFKGYGYLIVSIALIVAFAFFQYINSKKDSVNEIAINIQKVPLVNAESFSVREMEDSAINIRKNADISTKHKHSEPGNREPLLMDTDDVVVSEEPLPFPKELALMEEGLSIVSYEDQSIPGLFKTITRRIQQEMDEQGYTLASENDVYNIDLAISSPYLISHEKAVDNFISEPASIEGTPFEDKKIIGGTIGGVNIDGKWTGLTRLFEFEDLGVVELEEDDYITARSSIQFTKELINQDINGNPAVYLVKVSESGKSITTITWITDSKKYSLSMNKNASQDENLKDDFINLARSLTTEVGSFSLNDLSDHHSNINEHRDFLAEEPPPPL